MLTEAARHELYTRLEAAIGSEPASTLMSMLPPTGWADVATLGALDGQSAVLRSELDAQTALLRTEMTLAAAGLRGEMAELRDELRGEMAELRDELRGEMAELRDELRGEMAELRTEMRVGFADVRTEMAVSQRRLALTLIAAMASFSGLSFAATAAML